MCVLLRISIAVYCFFFFKQKTAYEMRISDWSSDVCSSDLLVARDVAEVVIEIAAERAVDILEVAVERPAADVGPGGGIIGLDALGVGLGETRDAVPAAHARGIDHLQRPDERAGEAPRGLATAIRGGWWGRRRS